MSINIIQLVPDHTRTITCGPDSSRLIYNMIKEGMVSCNLDTQMTCKLFRQAYIYVYTL